MRLRHIIGFISALCLTGSALAKEYTISNVSTPSEMLGWVNEDLLSVGGFGVFGYGILLMFWLGSFIYMSYTDPRNGMLASTFLTFVLSIILGSIQGSSGNPLVSSAVTVGLFVMLVVTGAISYNRG